MAHGFPGPHESPKKATHLGETDPPAPAGGPRPREVGKMRFVPTDDILLKVSEGICQYFRTLWGWGWGWLVGIVIYCNIL